MLHSVQVVVVTHLIDRLEDRGAAVQGAAEELQRRPHHGTILNLNNVLPVVAEVVDVAATFIICGKILSKFDGTSDGRIRLVIVGFRIF